MSKHLHMIAIDAELNEDVLGTTFLDTETCEVYDVSQVKIVHAGTDTVKQLYNGSLQEHILALFDEIGFVEFAGYTWSAGRIGRDSGYQYKLQNADLGVVMLIKAFHVQADAPGNHLKIEVSPHAILSREPTELQRLLDFLASEVLEDFEKRQCAVHLCVDVQGWVPPQDFDDYMHCRSTRVRKYNTISEINFDHDSAVYGKAQSFLFGSAGGIQLAVYDKTEQAKATDRLDYWRSVWSESPEYDEEETVFRIEFRYHHTVIDQFSQGTINTDTGEIANFFDFAELSNHLTGLWSYGFQAYKYLVNETTYHPVWTLLSRHAFLNDGETFEYKRHYKSASGFSGKNVELMLGNLISLAARKRLSGCQLWKMIKKLPVFDVISEHYLLKGIRHYDLSRHIKNLLQERYIVWGKAI